MNSWVASVSVDSTITPTPLKSLPSSFSKKAPPRSPSHGSTSFAKSNGSPSSCAELSSFSTMYSPRLSIPATRSAIASVFDFSSPEGRTVPSTKTGVLGGANAATSEPEDPLPQPAGRPIRAAAANAAKKGRGFMRPGILAVPSLDRNRLRQISGLIDVETAGAGNVVGEQLQRQDRQDRLQDPVRGGDLDRLVGDRAGPLLARGDDRDRLGSPRPHLFDVGEDLAEDRALGRYADDRRRLVEQGDRAVLHLASGVGVGRDVGDLLQLQRPLEADRKAEVAAEVKEELPVGERRRDLAHTLLAAGQRRLHLRGQRLHLGDQLGKALRRQRSP